MTELKACPFCGGQVEVKTGEAMLEQVRCPSCGATSQWSTTARETWNKRTSKETELKPCPLCGGQGKLYDSYNREYAIRCKKCDLMTAFCTDAYKAKEMWNRRAKNAKSKND